LNALVAATWGAAPPRSSRLAVLARVARRVVLDAMMDLASSEGASPEVRGRTLLVLSELRGRLAALRPSDRAERADVLLARRDVAEFLDRPEARKDRHAPPPAPPGRPIGLPAR
jgi:hypothetical protein